MTTQDNLTPLPDLIRTELELEEVMSRPGKELIRFVGSIRNPLLVLGAGGKMGPSLAVLAHRAAAAARHPLEVIAVSRFSDPRARQQLEDQGVRTLSGDLLDPRFVASLPEASDVIYLVGLKFGTAQNPAATWAMNTLVPSAIATRFPRARLVALSTGNVYPLTEVALAGAVESNPLTPLGEYANAAVARERIFEFQSRQLGSRVALLRLFYALDLRYGVISDLARMIHAGETIPLANGSFNCIWQGDANEMILRSLSLTASPPGAWNLCQPEAFSVRETALKLGELLDRNPSFTGTEARTALLGNPTRICDALGRPPTPMDTVLRWTAHWVRTGGRSLNKPTHFEVRDGNY
jgi:nucleoside-diphosphate-sugar epimerase